MQKINSEVKDTYVCEADQSIALVHRSYPQPLSSNVDQVTVMQGMNSRNEGGKELFTVLKSFGNEARMLTDGPLPDLSTEVYDETMLKVIELLSLTGKEVSVFIDNDTPLPVQQNIKNAAEKAAAKLVF